LVVKPRDGVSLTTVEERLFAGLASQAGLVLRGTALRVQLGQRLVELAERADELRASRQRVIDAQDESRRLLERDIHDGAQQHLVALAVNLRLAHVLSETAASAPADEVVSLLANQRRAAGEAMESLMRLSQGIYPPLLSERGLKGALASALESSSTPVRLESTLVDRYAREVEAAAYFCTLEAVQNAAKHAGASVVRVALAGRSDCLSILVEDDGVGFTQSQVAGGAGLVNMRDRVEAVGGVLTVESEPGTGTGTGTRVSLDLPAVARDAVQGSTS
jgi:signal transduction histidine kinase